MATGELSSRLGLRLLGREMILGLIHGVVLGAIIGGIAWAWQGNAVLGAVLALAMTGNMIVASIAGAGVPLLPSASAHGPGRIRRSLRYHLHGCDRICPVPRLGGDFHPVSRLIFAAELATISFDFRGGAMPGAIALVGGDEFRAGCEEMDRDVMRASAKDPARVIIIPTAAVTGPAKAANDGVTHFSSLGGVSSELMVLEAEQANDAAFCAPVTDADVVYFTGGNPDHLLSTLRDSVLLRLLREGLERGLVLGGSSAGAMVMGSIMRRPPLYSSTGEQGASDRWVEGLGIAPGICVLPHHERRDPSETAAELARSAPPGTTYLGIDARTGVLGGADNWLVTGFGKVTVYRDNDYAVFASGDRIPAGI